MRPPPPCLTRYAFLSLHPPAINLVWTFANAGATLSVYDSYEPPASLFYPLTSNHLPTPKLFYPARLSAVHFTA